MAFADSAVADSRQHLEHFAFRRAIRDTRRHWPRGARGKAYEGALQLRSHISCNAAADGISQAHPSLTEYLEEHFRTRTCLPSSKHGTSRAHAEWQPLPSQASAPGSEMGGDGDQPTSAATARLTLPKQSSLRLPPVLLWNSPFGHLASETSPPSRRFHRWVRTSPYDLILAQSNQMPLSTLKCHRKRLP